MEQAMTPFSFLHAADLHLDAPFKGLGRNAQWLSEELRQSVYTALENMVSLCLEKKPDALILAGDLHNGRESGIRAQFALRDACDAVAKAGVSVFVAHGNHDPLLSAVRGLWPEGVTVFGADAVESHVLRRGGERLALVHGISQSSENERGNLSALFRRAPEDIWQIGVLHCDVGGTDPRGRYAPCALSELQAAGMDYWALGHIHKRGCLCESPLIVYPGSVQGLHANETGPHGACLVRVDATGGSALEFHRLGPVEWRDLRVPASGCSRADELESRVLEASRALLDEVLPARGLVIRLILTGATALNSVLRAPVPLAELRDQLNADMEAARSSTFVWIQEIIADTTPELDLALLRKREDLVGETLRCIAEAEDNPQALLESLPEVLGELYGASRIRKLGLPLPDEERARRLVNEAAFLCLEKLGTFADAEPDSEAR